jgi:hypothetical protein
MSGRDDNWVFTATYGWIRLMQRAPGSMVVRVMRWHDQTEMSLPADTLRSDDNRRANEEAWSKPATTEEVARFERDFAKWRDGEPDSATGGQHALRTYQPKAPRVAYCWKCGGDLASGSDVKCGECGWLRCSCGACGCKYRSHIQLERFR